MKGKDLLKAMEYLDEDIIEAAHEENLQPNHKKRRVLISLAACLACVFILWSVCILPIVQKSQKGGGKNPENPADRNNWEEICIPSVRELYLDKNLQMVSEDDLIEFNLKWKEEGAISNKNYEDIEFFCDFMDAHKVQVIGIGGSSADYYFIGESIDSSVAPCDPSMSAYYLVPTLFSGWIYSSKYMNQENPDELKVYFAKIADRKEEAQKQANYIAKYLNETDYGGAYYDAENGKYTILLKNENYRKLLEEQGIVCKTADFTMQQLYEKMNELWEKRKELGIIDISKFYYGNTLSVEGELNEEEFQEKLNETAAKNNWDISDLNRMISYHKAVGDTPEEKRMIFGISSARGIEDIEEFMELLQALYDSDYGADLSEPEMQQYFKNLKTALIKLKEKYPEYTYLQLYYHVSTDCEYEYYLNFDRELENFVDSLPVYKKDMDFLRERQYGDPQRLGLKTVLYYYKQLYPKESYEELYKTYLLQKNLESDTCPKAEGLYQYLYIKAVQKELLEKKQGEKSAAISKIIKFSLYTFLGCALLFLGMFMGLLFRKKRMKKEKHMEKAEFRRYLIRETAALSANIAIFILLPYILNLTAPMEIMGTVFLADYYLGVLFGLFGCAIYVWKKGNWWSFMLYTTCCLILQPLALLSTAASTYGFLLYILPAEIIGTLFVKLKERIKIV